MLNYLAERKQVTRFALVVMLVTMVPYLIGYASQGDAWRFTGFVIGVEDGNTYLAKMLSGANGDWLFRSPFSIEPQRGVLAFLPYLILGKLTSQPGQHEQLVALYHGFRFIAGLLAIYASYDFISMFIQKKSLRLWALVVVVLGGGLGWIFALAEMKDFFGSVPLDFISPESFGFLGLLAIPHLAAARALLLWGFVKYLEAENGAVAGVLWLVMGLFQPLIVLVVWAVIGMHTAALFVLHLLGIYQGKNDLGWSQDQLPGKALLAVMITSPLVGYTAYSFLTDPYLIDWTAQNFLPSPHWVHYLIAYGLLLPLSIPGIYMIWKRSPWQGILLGGWMIIFPILISAPVGTQRRLAEGFWVVLVTGAAGLFSEDHRLPWYAKLITVLLLPTSFLLVGGSALRAVAPARPVFIPAQEAAAYLALNKEAEINAHVLSSYQSGNNLPAWSPVQVVIGHGPESVNLAKWKKLLDTNLNGVEGNPCRDLFHKHDINLLFWGPAEQEQWGFDPLKQECLDIFYQSSGYSIFRVDN